MVTNSQEILKRLPYDRPFLFVDDLIEINENGSKGSFTYHKDLDFYRGHFKNAPITPGVILIETMAQIGLVCLGIFLTDADGIPNTIAMTSADVEFLKPVPPGETVVVTSTKIYFRFGKLSCVIKMEDQTGAVVCKGKIAGMLIDKKDA